MFSQMKKKTEELLKSKTLKGADQTQIRPHVSPQGFCINPN